MIVKETFYGCACDNCKTVYEGYESSFWSDIGVATDYAREDGWLESENEDSGKIYCPSCAKLENDDDEDSKLIIDLTRFKEK